jgi:hypothetical protein
VNVQLVSTYIPVIKHYRGLTYDRAKLINWIHHTKGATSFNFSQLYELNGKETVAKTSKALKLFVLKVHKYDIYPSEG